MTAPAPTGNLQSIFQGKYTEFCDKLAAVLPEFSVQISAALGLDSEKRVAEFSEKVLPGCGPSRDATKNPGTVLPGVTISDELWNSLSEGTQKAIQEYLTLLSMCSLYDSSKFNFDASGGEFKAWTDEFLNTWREKMNSVDFDSISKKIGDMMGGLGPDKMPKLPEKFLKGHLAKLAEELIREFKPEDFGLSAEELKACDAEPARAFTLLTEIYTKKPEILQKAIQRIANRLQEKVRRGEIRPDQIAAEAEELIKEFSGNGAFVEMMESFRSTFGMEDPDLARDVGRDGDARRNLVRERLRKKMDAKKGGKK
jgi:hypothetical protein